MIIDEVARDTTIHIHLESPTSRGAKQSSKVRMARPRYDPDRLGYRDGSAPHVELSDISSSRMSGSGFRHLCFHAGLNRPASLSYLATCGAEVTHLGIVLQRAEAPACTPTRSAFCRHCRLVGICVPSVLPHNAAVPACAFLALTYT